MDTRFQLDNVTRHFTQYFRRTTALRNVSVRADGPTIIGLIGTNGSGKTTLLRHITGLYLPSAGECKTFGVPVNSLGPSELARIGVVHQKDPLISWMNVGQHLRYVESFYPRWDRDLQNYLLDVFELHPAAPVGTLSPGNAQRLALIFSVCHRPDLLLLDEPLSDLDPLAREKVLKVLLDRFGNDELTIVVSSHLLRDIERIVDRIVCLDRGRVVADSPLDVLQEEFAEWIVRSPSGNLPERFAHTYVLSNAGNSYEALLEVRGGAQHLEALRMHYDAEIEVRPLNLERIFPLLITASRKSTSDSDGSALSTAGMVR